MTALKCYDCGKPHDFNLGPDIGVCLECNGRLVEGEENPAVLSSGVNEAFYSLIRAHILSQRKSNGEN